MRNALRAGAGAVVVLVIMILGSLGLWVGVPAGWLWVGSQIQGSTGNLGTAMAVMMGGVLVSVVLLAMALGWLNRKHAELREARGLEVASNPLEIVMVATAAVAVVAFVIWFFVFAGPGPSLAPR